MTKKTRLSNIELLRVISMLMILGLHVNFFSNGWPEPDNVFTATGMQCMFFEHLCFGAVNLFVLISGWFGIRANIKGFLNLIWMVMFFMAIYISYCVATGSNLHDHRMWLGLLGICGGGGWFTASYIGLYIISPILNAFIDSASMKKLVCVLAVFYGYEVIWGATSSAGFFINGYSMTSFIALYLLAAALRRSDLRPSKLTCFGIFIGCVLTNGILHSLSVYYGIRPASALFTGYYSPFLVIGPAALLLMFAEIKPFGATASKVINWFSASSFAVYLFHCGCGNPVFVDIFKEQASSIFQRYSGIDYMWRIIGFMLGVYMAATVLDQVRIAVWKHLLGPAAGRLQAAVERRIERA